MRCHLLVCFGRVCAICPCAARHHGRCETQRPRLHSRLHFCCWGHPEMRNNGGAQPKRSQIQHRRRRRKAHRRRINHAMHDGGTTTCNLARVGRTRHCSGMATAASTEPPKCGPQTALVANNVAHKDNATHNSRQRGLIRHAGVRALCRHRLSSKRRPFACREAAWIPTTSPRQAATREAAN